MNKVKYCIVICSFLGFANVFGSTSDFSGKLLEFRNTIGDFVVAKTDQMQLLNKIVKQKQEITAIVSSSKQAKATLIGDMGSFGKKNYDGDSGSNPAISRDYTYHQSLMEILCQIDRDRFLAYAREVSKSKDIHVYIKESCLSQVNSMRISTHIKSPKGLKDLDPKIIEIYRNFLNPSNGIKANYKIMRMKRQFVSYLMGRELIEGKLILPAADKALGLKLAKEVANDDRRNFFEKKWFMKQAAKYDSDILGKYLAEMKEYVYNENMTPQVRLKLAEELRKYEKVDDKLIEQLKNKVKIGEGNIIKKGKGKAKGTNPK